MRVRRPERGVPLFDNADGHREKLRAWGLLQDRVNDTRCRPARRPTDPSRRAVRIPHLTTPVGPTTPPAAPPPRRHVPAPSPRRVISCLLDLREGMVKEIAGPAPPTATGNII